MSELRRKIDDFLLVGRVALDNAQQSPEIAEAVARYGYDKARLAAGERLLAQAKQLLARQQSKYSDQYQATEALHQAFAAADKVYTAHRALARLAIKRMPQKDEALALNERKKTSLSGWLGQATVFYDNAPNDPELVAALARFNLTPEKLYEGQRLVQQVADLHSAQARGKYEAQQATADRNAVLDELDEWLAEFRTVAKLALADRPQQLEALGFRAVA